LQGKKILVTGGAGFIGCFLIKYLLNEGNSVTVFDNFSRRDNLHDITSENLDIIKGDLSTISDLEKLENHFDTIFHLAADPEVRLEVTTSESIFKNNLLSTFNLLEWLKQSKATSIVFTSTSAVYGDVNVFPTPETHPCIPISLYGASKIACESLISAYSHTYKKRGIIIRLANVVGQKSDHGIIFDMLNKLRKNKNEIEILGDGKQNKSYLYIDDCISGIMKIVERYNSKFGIFNLGSDSQIKVKDIIDIILEEVQIKNVKKIFTGGVDGGRGWPGDIRTMLLDIQKAMNFGWQPTLNSSEAIRKTVREIIQLEPLD